jgi:hypothetical protein
LEIFASVRENDLMYFLKDNLVRGGCLAVKKYPAIYDG